MNKDEFRRMNIDLSVYTFFFGVVRYGHQKITTAEIDRNSFSWARYLLRSDLDSSPYVLSLIVTLLFLFSSSTNFRQLTPIYPCNHQPLNTAYRQKT